MSNIELKKEYIAAKKSGQNDLAKSILNKINNAPKEAREMGFWKSLPQGVNNAIANTAGAPVDLFNYGLSGIEDLATKTNELITGKKIPNRRFFSSDMPAGGSADIKRGMRAALGNVVYDRLEDLNPADRKYAVAGETFGNAVSMAALPLSLARTAGAANLLATKVSPTISGAAIESIVKPVIRAAKETPGRFALTETGLASGSALGAMDAEHLAPGNPYARMGGEIVGGILNPSRIVQLSLNAGKSGLGALGSLSGNFSRNVREQKAADILEKAFTKSGENKAAVIAALRNNDEFGNNLTAGQKSSSPTILAVEKQLASSNPTFSNTVNNLPPIAFDRMKQAVGETAGSANQPALTEAARQNLARTQQNISVPNTAALAEALRARNAVGNVSVPEMAAASARARGILENAEQSAGNRQSAAWDQIPLNEPGNASNVLAAREQIKDRLLPEENMPGPIGTYTSRLAQQADTGNASVTSGELLRLRTRALTAARDARSGISPNSDLANQMETIARGALADLNNIESISPSVVVARNISRELHDDFTRTFAGESTSLKSTGAPSVEPENMLTKALGAGGTAGDVKMRQLSQAAERGDVGRYPRQEYQEAMNKEQEIFLRGAVQDVMDSSGRVVPDKLAAWTRANEAILKRFPQLRDDLNSAATAENTATRIAAIAQEASTNANKTKIAAIAAAETPSGEIGKVLNPNNPNRAREYEIIANMAKESGPDALEGLGSASMESVFKSGVTSSGGFNFEQFSTSLLYKGPDGKSPSLLDLMQTHNVLDGAKAGRLNTILERASKLESAINNPSLAENIIGEPDALTDFLTRVLGANIGTKLNKSFGGGGSGASLIAGSAGSKILRNFFDKIPSSKVSTILTEAAENPHFMAMLLEKSKTPAQAKEITRQMNAFLYGSGVNFMRDEPEEDRKKRPLAKTLNAVGQ